MPTFNAVDDHSRLACGEILTDEREETAAAFWTRGHAYFASYGVTVRRVLTDNGPVTSRTTGATPLRRRGYRTSAHARIGRRPTARWSPDEWAYATPYCTEAERRETFPDRQHSYNHHRGHTALNGRPPASRVTNLVGQYTERSRQRSAVGAAWWHDPLGGLAGEGGDHVEIAVVMEDGQPVQFCRGSDEKVGE